jgi:hypothetical protein
MIKMAVSLILPREKHKSIIILSVETKHATSLRLHNVTFAGVFSGYTQKIINFAVANKWSVVRVVRNRSAKPGTAVRTERAKRESSRGERSETSNPPPTSDVV